MRRPTYPAVVLISLSVLLAGCGAAASGRVTATRATKLARWTASASVRRVLDLSAPRRDGTIIVAAAARLALLRPGATSVQPFAPGYASPGGEEPYIALSSATRPRAPGCRFAPDTVYALRLRNGAGVTVVGVGQSVHRFARLPERGLESGIAFDDTGRFGYRLLVTVTAGARTTVDAVDCRGAVTTITRDAPKVEGGIVVAPATFGRFGGDLIAPDEHSGRIYAIGPNGRTQLVANSGLPHGADIGVESAGFVPAGFGARGKALLADRLTPGNPHPGDDVVLSLGAAALSAAGVRPGDLLVAGEGGARTDAVSCRRACRVRYVADGPPVAHAEGHIAFTTG